MLRDDEGLWKISRKSWVRHVKEYTKSLGISDRTHIQEQTGLWGISLLCHTAKTVSSILFHKVRQKTEDILSEAQRGFWPSRSTLDQIFTLRQLAENYKEFGQENYKCATQMVFKTA